MLDSAFAWLQSITEWLGRFIPRWTVITVGEGAVYYVRGKHVHVVGAGVHWHWPVWTHLQQYPTARQTDRLEAQTIMTSDGKTFLVSGTLTYKVTDLGKLLPVTHNPATLAIDIAMAAVHDVCCDLDADTLRAEQRHATKLKTKLRNAAASQLEEYGIDVIKLQLNSLGPCRVLKVSQSVSQEEN